MSSQTRPTDSHAAQLGAALHDLLQAFVGAQETAARQQQLHPTDFACIGFLYRQGGPVSAKEVAAYLRLSSGSGTAVLDRLEKAGFLHRQPNPNDRRGVLITLDVKAARKPLEQYRQLHGAFHGAIEGFTDHEIGTVTLFLSRFTEQAQQLESMTM